MRRSISLTLVLFFGLLPLAPLFAPDAEANLPACCRRNGKHHCMMAGMRMTGTQEPAFTNIPPKCPYLPLGTSSAQTAKFLPEVSQRLQAQIRFDPAYIPQSPENRSILFQYGYPKRGPPSFFA